MAFIYFGFMLVVWWFGVIVRLHRTVVVVVICFAVMMVFVWVTVGLLVSCLVLYLHDCLC